MLCASMAGHCLEVRAQASLSIKEQVIATERAFAKTTADRNQPQFSRFISAEAVFFSREDPLRGESKIVDGWLKKNKRPAVRRAFDFGWGTRIRT
jgi:hypothetical protein